jgi:hypothetical protein
MTSPKHQEIEAITYQRAGFGNSLVISRPEPNAGLQQVLRAKIDYH